MKRTYNLGEFEIPSFTAQQVALVAQWSQYWNSSKHTTASDIQLGSVEWAQKLSEAEHMVALISVEGVLYVPVRAPERDGVVQHLVTADNAVNILSSGLKTSTPFRDLDLHPEFMGFNFRNFGVGTGEGPFSDVGLPDGMVLVSTNERERNEILAGYLAKNFLLVDGILFTKVEEPKIVVRPTADKVYVSILTNYDDDALTPVFNHYFRLDDYERAMQMIEDRWSADTVEPRFTDLITADSNSLSNDFELSQALRLVKRFHIRLARSLQEFDWDVAEPWYALKKLLAVDEPGEEQIDEMVSLLERASDALEKNSNIDAEWRDKTVLYARLGVERWNYRPILSAGPRF
jgi:hypothetical protein